MTVEQVEEIFQQMHDLQAEINEAAQRKAIIEQKVAKAEKKPTKTLAD